MAPRASHLFHGGSRYHCKTCWQSWMRTISSQTLPGTLSSNCTKVSARRHDLKPAHDLTLRQEPGLLLGRKQPPVLDPLRDPRRPRDLELRQGHGLPLDPRQLPVRTRQSPQKRRQTALSAALLQIRVRPRTRLTCLTWTPTRATAAGSTQAGRAGVLVIAIPSPTYTTSYS